MTSRLGRAVKFLSRAPLLVVLTAMCAPEAGQQPDRADERRRMVEQQLRARDIKDARVLAAMERVPRHRFVPESVRDEAYNDHPVPIGHGQTISQPYIVGFMSEALEIAPEDRVLEIGTGSGYQAAILGELAAPERLVVALLARATLDSLGYRTIHVRAGNGYDGWPEHAPYDRIIVTAAPPEVPPALVEQLKPGGLMAVPVGTVIQELKILRRTESGVETLKTLPVQFVPMTGRK